MSESTSHNGKSLFSDQDWPHKNIAAHFRNRIRYRFQIFKLLFVLLLFLPLRAISDNCHWSQCESMCAYFLDAFTATAQFRWESCMNRCKSNSNCQSPAESQKMFGAIAYSPTDGYRSFLWRGKSLKSAEADALAHCRDNSKRPNDCRVVTSYQDSCGALAAGNRFYFATPADPNSGKSTRAEAEAAALKECRDAHNDGSCKVLVSSCANEISDEERAQAAKTGMAILGGIVGTLDGLLNGTRRPAQEHQKTPAMHLKTQEVLPVDQANWLYVSMRHGPPERRTIIEKNIRQIAATGSKVMFCRYGIPELFVFWHEKVPATQAQLKQVSIEHPLGLLGDKAREKCPATSDVAKKWAHDANKDWASLPIREAR